MKIRIGTRKSKLALAQSHWIGEQLKSKWPELEVEFIKITTKGDKILDVPLAQVGGKGLFVKEIEEALLTKTIDIAVHSLKDVPTELPDGLEVSIFPKREDPRDALISKNNLKLAELPEGSKVGTSSLRRQAQLKAFRPDLHIESLRGNLDTRINRLDQGDFDAIVVAAAGLSRLGKIDRVSEFLDPELMLPAIGQGALGIELRSEDQSVKEVLSTIHHEETSICVKAERAFLLRLEGGCQVPIGALANLNGTELSLEGLVADEQGQQVIRLELSGDINAPEDIGINLADQILRQGADKILAQIYGAA